MPTVIPTPTRPYTPSHADHDRRCPTISKRGDGASHDLMWAMVAIFILCLVLIAAEH